MRVTTRPPINPRATAVISSQPLSKSPRISFSRSSILSRYIFREMLAPFLIALFVFTGILFLVRVLKLVDLVVNKNVAISDILLLFSYILPRFFETALPMALLIGVIFAFGRLSSDSELVVMRATGIPISQLSRPVWTLSALIALVTLLLSLWITPWANFRLGIGLFEVAKAQASRGLVAGVFNEVGPLTVYAEQITEEGSKLQDVIISDERQELPTTYFARNGQLLADDESRSLTLRLFGGSIHRGTGANYNLTYFDINNINLDENLLVETLESRDRKKPNEMLPSELVNTIGSISARQDTLDEPAKRNLRSFQIEFHRRLAFAFTCIWVGLMGMALGIQPSRGGASWGPVLNISVSVLIIFAYYIALALMTALSQDGVAPVWLLLWLPNVIFALIAWRLFRFVESEQWMAVSQGVAHVIKRSTKWLQQHMRPIFPGSES